MTTCIVCNVKPQEILYHCDQCYVDSRPLVGCEGIHEPVLPCITCGRKDVSNITTPEGDICRECLGY